MAVSGGPADLRLETTIERIVANDDVAVNLDLKRVVTFPISFIHSLFHRFLSLHATGFSDRSRGRALTPQMSPSTRPRYARVIQSQVAID